MRQPLPATGEIEASASRRRVRPRRDLGVLGIAIAALHTGCAATHAGTCCRSVRSRHRQRGHAIGRLTGLRQSPYRSAPYRAPAKTNE